MDEKREKLAAGFVEEVVARQEENLVSVILYGSAAEGKFIAGKSDLNFLIVLKTINAESLDTLAKPLRSFLRRGVASPLILDGNEIMKSLDSFPMEFLDMKLSHRLLHGEDVLSDLPIDPSHLRVQCEREIKGKLIQLQRAYLGEIDKGRDYLFGQSAKSLLFPLRAMLWLCKASPLPRDPESIATAVEKLSRIPLPHYRKALQFLDQKPRLAKPEIRHLFTGYLEEVRALADWVDAFECPGPGR